MIKWLEAIMQVTMLETLEGKEFSFVRGEKYKSLDGDETGVKELIGKILVRQPNSPKKKNWWCMFDKSYAGKRFIFDGSVKGYDMTKLGCEWFQMDNDEFFKKYGFNFNPHQYPGLYEHCRELVYPKEGLLPLFN